MNDWSDMNLTRYILQIERLILPLTARPCADADYHEIRRLMQNAICLSIGQKPNSARSLPDDIEAATHYGERARDVAILLVRCLGVDGLLPDNTSSNQLQRKLVELVEAALPDICKEYRVAEWHQSFEKFDAIRGIHKNILDRLKPISEIQTSVEKIKFSKEDIFRTTGNKVIKSYLQNVDFIRVGTSIKTITDAVAQLNDLKDATFGPLLLEVRKQVTEELAYCEETPNFLTQDIFGKFLNSVSSALTALDEDSKGRFECVLELKTLGNGILAKRMPLHEVGRELKLTIPLVNRGPGIAIDVVANVQASDNLAVNGRMVIGNIQPGEFAFAVDALIVEVPQESLKAELVIELCWKKISQTKESTTTFVVPIAAQDPDIDWEELRNIDPYSTGVAEGKEFFGRKKKLQAIVNRLLKDKMESTYITGQKRIGKTSLALAVRDYLQSSSRGSKICELYLEWGDYAHIDPVETIDALGRRIEGFLTQQLPPNIPKVTGHYKGTIAPLNELAKILLLSAPDKRFLIILDEFDEVHPEMYRFGALAEIFFANLRTLSSKKNMAFMLVGGEKMPFIMGAQGDQLNKFVSEPLDYFARAEEWTDFVDLIRKPVERNIRWDESALNAIFVATSGHPYYTKLVCGKAFSNAVADHDVDITITEIQRACAALVTELDTNSFAHIWKDGIQGDREKGQAEELNRCRLLVAIARCLRTGKQATLDNICAENNSAELNEFRLDAILGDYCRREILLEKDGQFRFRVPLFEDWLVEDGFRKLITDTMGDEMAKRLGKAEDEARITANELLILIEKWPAYQGQRKTADDVRAWLQQMDSAIDQRLLFKILQNLRFLGETEIRDKLIQAHRLVLENVQPFVMKKKSDRRQDIIVTYVDGQGKSGQYYAARYAEQNSISSRCVLDPEHFGEAVQTHEEKYAVTVNSIVIIDDIAATGKTLSGKVLGFFNKHQQFLVDRSITGVIVVLLATKDGDEEIRKALKKLNTTKWDLRVCEFLDDKYFAFNKMSKIWVNDEEYQKAKGLCRDLGAKIFSNSPLGYGGLGLLVVFPDNCPNNSLPILHGQGKGEKGWRPLFHRLTN